MIYVVDDEPAELDTIVAALDHASLPVRGFTSPTEALAAIREAPPLLVISDVRMPGLSGFELREAIAAEPDGATIPFVFLSSLDEPDTIVRGIETGADDYLVKPVDPRILAAKVRSLLARGQRAPAATFRGDLAEYPFIKVLQFCERNALSGDVEVRAGGFEASVTFNDGAPMQSGRSDADEVLSKLFDLTAGSFVIRSRSRDFTWLGSAESRPATPMHCQRAPRPTGRLSAVEIGGRLLQVQTEVIGDQVLTIVMLDGRTLLKRASSTPAEGGSGALDERIATQHRAVETEIRERAELLSRRPADANVPSRQGFYELVDAGFAAYRRGEIEASIEHWRNAQRVFPGDAALEVNIAVAQRRLDGSAK